MTAQMLAGIVIVLAATLGILRAARARQRAWIASIALQAASAALLWFVLAPPVRSGGSESMLVLTPAADAVQRAAAGSARRDGDTHVVSLPGAEADPSIERVPDLGTALRRHPRVSRLQVLGAGLLPRDRDAVRGLALAFDAVPLPPGIIELALPPHIVAGSIWRLHGRVAALGGGSLELRDRAAAVIARATPDDEGRFALDVRAKGEGTAQYSLHALAADDTLVEELPVAVAVQAGERVRVLLLAGAPDAELKYLRRWAVDAGIDLRSRMMLSRGIALREGEPGLDAASLRESDLVIVDERAWSALSAVEKQALSNAIDDGLGVLLRVTGPVPATTAGEWAALGFRIAAADIAQTVALPGPAGSGAADVAVTRRAIRVDARDGRTLVAAADGTALATWRARGRGRIALWWLLDSHRLALGGDAQRFGSLWSDALATLARARAPASPQLPQNARVDQRSALCGIGSAAFVEDANGMRNALAIDPSTPGCAAYWPAQAGWHALVDGEARRPFFVFAAGQGVALERMQTGQATRALVATPAPDDAPMHAVPGPRWPWFLAWLAAVTLLWWLERRATQIPPSSFDTSEPVPDLIRERTAGNSEAETPQP